jgi:hypothetical protein
MWRSSFACSRVHFNDLPVKVKKMLRSTFLREVKRSVPGSLETNFFWLNENNKGERANVYLAWKTLSCFMQPKKKEKFSLDLHNYSWIVCCFAVISFSKRIACMSYLVVIFQSRQLSLTKPPIWVWETLSLIWIWLSIRKLYWTYTLKLEKIVNENAHARQNLIFGCRYIQEWESCPGVLVEHGKLNDNGSMVNQQVNKEMKLKFENNEKLLKLSVSENIFKRRHHTKFFLCWNFVLSINIRYDTIREQRSQKSPLSRALPAYYKRFITTVPGVGPRMACTRYQCKVTHEKRW